MSALPTASTITEIPALPLETILAAIKVAEYSDLLRILKVTTSELEKKGLKSAKTAVKVPRKGSQPKGVLPAQLHKPRAWTEYVLARAQKEGWGEFTNGTQTFGASIKGPDGFVFAEDNKPFNMRHAMSLAKTYWSTATKTGSRPEWYAAFEKTYVAPAATEAPAAAAAAPVAPAAAPVAPKKKPVVTK
jgi:hypothetical protein